MAVVSKIVNDRWVSEGRGGISATIIADSVSRPAGLNSARITTMQLRYPRFIHAEFMTHRVFSRNASSSRAIPVAKMLEQVRNDPAMPIHWGKNQPGMQAAEELTGNELRVAQELWRDAAHRAADIAAAMSGHYVHKQVANRILEPFQFINVIVTATEWTNFFELRDHQDAQPEIRELARCMRGAMGNSTPVERPGGSSANSWLGVAEDNLYWHLPYVTARERGMYQLPVLLMLSAARCARVSYMKHDGTSPSVEEDIGLFKRLVAGEPLHASPIEHQAKASNDSRRKSANFVGWNQFREWYRPEWFAGHGEAA